MRYPVVPIVLVMALCAAAARAQAVFDVVVDPAVAKGPVTGRLVVYLIRADVRALRGRSPADAPFFEAPQPMFAIDLAGAEAGKPYRVDDEAASFPVPPSKIGWGTWRAQAVLHRHRSAGSWRDEPGTPYSDVVLFDVPGGEEAEPPKEPVKVTITLARETRAREFPKVEGAEAFEVRSAALSAFHGRDVTLRAGVVFPVGYEPPKAGAAPARRYPVVYMVPGFGGDHFAAVGMARQRRGSDAGTAAGRLARESFLIVLDPDSPNGHTLFADSANNGPVGRALVEELIPALEAKYPLEARPEARIVTGHSSGGWSSLWLATAYPTVFGACWSSAPDPVDFRRFQKTNIYEDKSVYSGLEGDTPSYRDRDGVVRMTVRQEGLMEDIVGPGNTSGMQWDSWQAVFGPRDARGLPAALFDPQTGAIDRAAAESYRAYDLRARLAKEPGVLGPLYKQRVRLIVGDADNFYLNEAVALLKAELDAMSFLHLPEGEHGSIEIVPGADHGTIFGSEAARRWPAQMLEHLSRAGLVKGPAKAEPAKAEEKGK